MICKTCNIQIKNFKITNKTKFYCPHVSITSNEDMITLTAFNIGVGICLNHDCYIINIIDSYYSKVINVAPNTYKIKTYQDAAKYIKNLRENYIFE